MTGIDDGNDKSLWPDGAAKLSEMASKLIIPKVIATIILCRFVLRSVKGDQGFIKSVRLV